MKFKVGDKVRVIKCRTMGNSCPCLGKIGTIIETDGCAPYLLDIGEDERWFDDELELIQKKTQFTKSDLKDGDIVTQRNNDKKIVCNNAEELKGLNIYTRLLLNYYTNDLVDKDGYTGFDIMKVERPVQYETIFEREEEILDETEKEYLKAVIRPFKNRVLGITKEECKNKQYIAIDIKNDSRIDLPVFEKDTMYRGMKVGYTYRLKELELKE